MMTEESFVYGVELKSPPPTTITNRLTQYDRLLKSEVMSGQFANQFPASPYHQWTKSDQTSPLFVNYATSPDLVETNITSSIGEILRQNIINEWHLRGGSTVSAGNGTEHDAAVDVVTTASGAAAASAGPAGANRASGDSTIQNNLIIPLYVVIFLLSVIGNLLVIFTLAQNKRMRTVTNVYLLNLAISDLLLGVFCMPFTLVGQVLRKFIFGGIMCKLIPYFQAVSVSVAVWTLVAISLERYFAICRPLSSRRWQTQFHAYKMITMVWLLSFLVNAPLCYVQRLQPVHRSNSMHIGVGGGGSSSSSSTAMKCREMWPDRFYEKSYVLFLDAGLLICPLLSMGFAYCMIVSKLWRGLQREISHTAYQKHKVQINNCPTECSSSGDIAVDAVGKPLVRSETVCFLLVSSKLSASGGTSNVTKRATPVASTRFGTSPRTRNLLSEGNTPAIITSAPSTNNAIITSSNCYYPVRQGCGIFRHTPAGANSKAATSKRLTTRLRMLNNFFKFRAKPVNTQKSCNAPTAKKNGLFSCSSRLQMKATSPACGKPYSKANIYSFTSETTLSDRVPTANTSSAGLTSSGGLRPTPTITADNGPTTTGDPPSIKQSSTERTGQVSYVTATSFSRHAIRSTYMDKSIETKKKVIRMLFVIIVEFFVCWAPLHILNTVYLYSPAFVYKYVSSNGIALVQLLAYISSCCNPITYCFMNRWFRQAFLNIFGCYQHRNSTLEYLSCTDVTQAWGNSRTTKRHNETKNLPTNSTASIKRNLQARQLAELDSKYYQRTSNESRPAQSYR
ncbi:5-hydroxytryptamine receptor 2A-like [Malaya genurostris]|uniref:5-hydroxytryptamine receptor 2A-like n=1 Tax=Malaya genurostris TaxID=325434 RepID=UPI0026F38E43|nr:5-hydroxytryptamine receptor 2A-like [Malaya genurostris]